MNITCYSDTLSGACGVGIVYEFNKEDYYHYGKDNLLNTENTTGGADWLTAAFIPDDEICKEAYAQLKNKYRIMLQTPVRVNKNSGNKFIFCVYNTKRATKAAREVANSSYKWPFA